MNKGIAYIRNKFVDLKDASIPVTDLGFQRGYGINEVLRTYGRKEFALNFHLDRMEKSAVKVGLAMPKRKEIEEIVQKGLEKLEKNKEYMIKIILTGGDGDHMILEGHPQLYVLFSELSPYSQERYEKGIRLKTYIHSRPEAEVKTLNYLVGVAVQNDLDRDKYDEVLYLSPAKGVLEGTTYNIAMIKDNEVISPKEGVLQGVTMEVALDRAIESGLKVTRRAVEFDELISADEVFITSTTREIMPVVKIDDYTISDGKPGEDTKVLIGKFREYVHSE